ncbi:SecY-interacting protein [Bowmanella yangjiangensis]|uniref:Protein Syd n=1 Tax=Bowmanella yangjiangensis TaxID=2811230 RepID=A0ABS3CY06_9ALTE|nr:SecY-interacting protein [Bowmanella yangjiangensis]MBN7821414.1 SecY-interacting protein [Bowmanella yangjiangensis]
MDVITSMQAFVQRYLEHHQNAQSPLITQWDADWLSPCQQSEPDAQGMIRWLPVARHEISDFRDTERALEIDFHPDIKAFFSAYWSENLAAITPRGPLQLLLPWNEDDFARLQQNLIGHVLMKKRLKQPITLFFAVTDDDDFILSIDNQSGQVMLERVGLPAKEVLAENLASFLESLTPQ